MSIRFHSNSLREEVIRQLTHIANAGESKFANHPMLTFVKELIYE